MRTVLLFLLGPCWRCLRSSPRAINAGIVRLGRTSRFLAVSVKTSLVTIHSGTGCGFLFAICVVGSAAPFANLGFEEANTNGLRTGNIDNGVAHLFGSTAEILPNWALTHGGTNVSGMNLNGYPLDDHYAALFNEEGKAAQLSRFDFNIDGRYALLVHFSHGMRYTLSQVGELPKDVRFLNYTYKGNPFKVSIDDVPLMPEGISFYPDSSTQASLRFDISQFAGRNVRLTLTSLGQPSGSDPFFRDAGRGYLDNISFSVVPEASTFTLFGVGGLLLFGRFWWKARG